MRGGASAKSAVSEDDDDASGAWGSTEDSALGDGAEGEAGEGLLRRDSRSREQAKDLRLDVSWRSCLPCFFVSCIFFSCFFFCSRSGGVPAMFVRCLFSTNHSILCPRLSINGDVT